MCEICEKLRKRALTQVGLDKMLDKIDEQFKEILELKNKLEHISEVALAPLEVSDNE